MEIDELVYPVLIWGPGRAFLAKSAKVLRMAAKSLHEQLRREAQSGRTFLVSADGKFFKVRDYRLSDKQPVLRWFFIRTDPVLDKGEKVELDRFKILVERAIRERQRGDLDSDFVGSLRARMPQARDYREALDCVPKGM